MGSFHPSDVLIAQTSVRVVVGDTQHKVRQGVTTAHASARIVRENPGLWGPFPVDFPAEAEAAAPVRPADTDSRLAWEGYAVALGLDVRDRDMSDDDLIALADGVAEGTFELRADGTVRPAPPTRSATRATWEEYAMSLGLNGEAVTRQANKADVIALTDLVARGEAVLDDDGYVELDPALGIDAGRPDEPELEPEPEGETSEPDEG